MDEPGTDYLPPAGTWLRAAAYFLPYRRGLFHRHLRTMRAGMAVVGAATAWHDVEVVSVSATSTVRIHRRALFGDR